jgi:hypothetical protein
VATGTRTAELIKERKLNRMRLGQAACDVVELPSDPEIRVALVPLTEAEFAVCASAVAAKAYSDDTGGLVQADRDLRRQILLLSCREVNDLSKRLFTNEQELQDSLDHSDVNFLTEQYATMTDASSPSLEGLSNEDMDELKKALVKIDWNGLSGRSWYLLKLFLSTISERQLLANSFGSSLTKE